MTMDNSDAATNTKPKPNETLRIGDLITLLIEAGVSFDLGYRSEGKPGKHFMGEVSEQRAFSDDPVTALLEAVARGVRTESEADRKARAILAESEAKMARINTLLPGLDAHIPPDADDGRCSCGKKHGPGEVIQALVRGLMNRGGVLVVDDDEAEPGEPEKKKDN